MSRRLPALLLALTLAACGGSSGSGGDKDATPTKESATKAATAINITKADAPDGFTGAAHDSTGDNSQEDKDLLACIGASAPGGEIVDIYGDDLSKGTALPQFQVSTDVMVQPTTDVVKKDLAAFQNTTKTTGCLTTELTKLVNEQGKQAGGLAAAGAKVTPFETKADGTDGAFGYTFTANLTASGLTVPVEIVVQGILLKHTELQLTTIGIGEVFPAAARTELFDKAVSRLKKNAV